MSKRIQAKKKLSRKYGVSLWGKANDSYQKRNYRPGQHGRNMKGRPSDYGTQLKAKQKMKFYYGNISEKQFRNIFKAANKIKGDVSENFIGLLESRLDITIFRSNFVPTVFAARQFVNHKHILVNGNVVNIPSYRLKVGDIVEIKEKSRNLTLVLESLQNADTEIPSYLSVDKANFAVKIISQATFAEVPYACEMEPHLITEYYSR